MKHLRFVTFPLLAGLVTYAFLDRRCAASLAAASLAAASPPVAPSQGAAGGPGPEHRLLERWVGSWDATVGEAGAAGTAAATPSAKAIVRLVCGGLWLVTDYEGAADGAPFSGHEVRGFDPHLKKYVINWVDSMTSSFDLGEGTFDEKTQTMSATMKANGPDGKPVTWRQSETWKDADTREWTMFRGGPDGKEMAVLQITYRRKK